MTDFTPSGTTTVSFDGRGVAHVTPALADPPDGLPPVLRRHSEDYDEPAGYTRFGWPKDWLPVDEVDEVVGRVQVTVAGKDVTYFRGVPCAAPSFTESEPFGDETALLRFPQISPHEQLGAGDLTWVRPWARVEIAFLLADGTREIRWEGSLASDEDMAGAGRSGGKVRLELHCIGALYRADLYMAPPPFVDTEVDLGRLLPAKLNRLVRDKSLPLGLAARVDTGIAARDHGSWNAALTGDIADHLAAAFDSTERQLTLALRHPRTPVFRWKDRTTVTCSVSIGGRGVDHALARDHSMAPNCIYGEGVAPDGGRWRGTQYPNLHPDAAPAYPLDTETSEVFTPGSSTAGFGPFARELREAGYPMVSGDTYAAADEDEVRAAQLAAGADVDGIVGPQTWGRIFQDGTNQGDLSGAYFKPLAIDPRVEPHLYNARGGIIGRNPAYDPHVARIERYENFGDRITKAEAVRSAKRELARHSAAGYAGDVALTADPEEGSRFRVVRAGGNLRARFHRGTGHAGRLLHIARVSCDLEDGAVNAEVDEQARDVMTLAAVRQRNRDTRNPAGRQRPTYRNSRQVEDRVATWDGENGSGIFPRGFAVFEGLWSVLPMLTAGRGTIVRTVVTSSSPAAKFALAVFDRPVTPAQLQRLIPNPLAYVGGNDPWNALTDATGHDPVLVWGGPDDACGYHPHRQKKDDGSGADNPITGRLVDDRTWYFESQRPPCLWVAVYSPTTCRIDGRFYAGADA